MSRTRVFQCVLLALLMTTVSCDKTPDVIPPLIPPIGVSGGHSLTDDAGGRKPSDFPELAIDVFKPMDGGIALSAEEIKGRNTWNLWTGGNEQFWDHIAREGLGLFDLLKTIDSRKRGTRFQAMGLINQPGFKQAAQPDKHGLWIDDAVDPEPAGIDPNVYGRPTGVLGFRLFDNPAFVGDAVKKWDAKRFYEDADYAAQRDLVRPYRIGASCGSCHIAFHPCHPPLDPESPTWENLASAIGNQYIREGLVFAHNVKEGGFFWEMLKSQPPGTSDTSRIATDHINNPNMINSIFNLGSRLSVAHEETLAGESLLLPGAQKVQKVPHVLKDGADSVGVPGATIRVYINIGMYSQHWLQQHNALLGLTKQKPFSIEAAQKNSVYWNATEQKFENIAKFFTKLTSYRLEDAPAGTDHMTKDEAVLKQGKLVFADNCARCHSSKRPPAGTDPTEWFRAEVLKPDFRDDNFFSDEARHPVTEIETNASRACASNAKAGHIWQNFSSETYKNLPAVGEIDVWNPIEKRNEKFKLPGGGSGYYRTPSLISLWSSAPFLHNNVLGKYTGDPSVAGRMAAFDDAAEKLFWPDKRMGHESIFRTSQECHLQVQAAVIPEPLRTLLKPHTDADGYFRLGPIPKGTPINLLANLDPTGDHVELIKLIVRLKAAVLKIKVAKLEGESARKELESALFKANTCPDLVEDRGHLFGTELPDADKKALIEYLKTL